MRFHIALFLLLPASAAPARKNWYDGLPNIKVLSPTYAPQEVVDGIFSAQVNGQFNANRYALLLTSGVYPDYFHIKVGYYTSVIGVGSDPSKVRLKSVISVNGANGHATNNFWRSFEGLSLWDQNVVWAVSQGAPVRRSIIEKDLSLSEQAGYSSGGFLADVKVAGKLITGSQQQWFFRNIDLQGGLDCPAGWNFVFVGVNGLSPTKVSGCAKEMPGKVSVVARTPRIAEKPYLVREDDAVTWHIYVPAYMDGPSQGATLNYASSIDRKLSLDEDVFIARPGDTDEDINRGVAGKRGLLVTPGVYRLKAPIVIKDDGFVVLGIGFATLLATAGLPVIRVADGLSDVRVAGLLLEAATPNGHGRTHPLLLWGTGARANATTPTSTTSAADAAPGTCADYGCSSKFVPSNDCQCNDLCAQHSDCCADYLSECKSNHSTTTTTAASHTSMGKDAGKAKSRRPKGSAVRTVASRRLLRSSARAGAASSGVLSDLFARIGSFQYQGCPVVRADTLMEINSDNVVLDNSWLWHADHDDCGTDPEVGAYGKSDRCHTEHGLVVNGKRVTAYGVATEHIVAGDILQWNGEEGETYFYQCELPYHSQQFGAAGYAGYTVAPHVVSHTAVGLGVYIIGKKLKVKSAFIVPPTVKAKNLVSVVIQGDSGQFQNTACVRPSSDGGERCYGPSSCQWMRCFLHSVPRSKRPPWARKPPAHQRPLPPRQRPNAAPGPALRPKPRHHLHPPPLHASRGALASCDELIAAWSPRCATQTWLSPLSFFGFLTFFLVLALLAFTPLLKACRWLWSRTGNFSPLPQISASCPQPSASL